jgi:hypothetical protein
MIDLNADDIMELEGTQQIFIPNGVENNGNRYDH